MGEAKSDRIPTLKEENCKFREEFKKFIKNWLVKDPNLRPRAKELLENYKKFLDKVKENKYTAENILKGCPNLHEIFQKMLNEKEQYFIR